MFGCHFLESYDEKKRFEKRVILWCTSLSEQWNLGMPTMRQHAHLAPGRERCQKFSVANDFDAPRHGRRQQSPMRFNHHHHQKVQHGTQHSIPTMEMGGAHECHRHNYHTGNQFLG